MTEFLEQLNKLIEKIGVANSFWLLIVVGIILFLRRIYNDHMKTKETNAVLEEKERALQRVANQERAWRVFFFTKMHGWTQEQCDRFIMMNDFSSPEESRNTLESKRQEKPK